ncbi:hypothetical protein BN946_scf184884.g69 [Trametes cinnabarina]|uniref:Amino acid transporter transmembrane domain-containing protein n=1 Tax=Pycnoporus cinnabarinus TaxID=5643 RepID=A0A060S6D3_PYCCI|nr:hypothetical protein BN946_scf184884.g69 [Trametes cinnabarina]
MADVPDSPRSSRSSNSFDSGRHSPINGFDSTAALILVPDAEETPASTSFDFSSDDDLDAEEQSVHQLDRIRNSSIPPLSSISVFLYLLVPYLKLGALLLPEAGLQKKTGVLAVILFAALSAFTRHIWYMLARYVRRSDLEEIVLDTFARGRGKERRRLVLRQLVRLGVALTRVLVAALYLRFSVDCLLPFLPDVLVIQSRLITTLILAAFLAPLYAARSLNSRSVVYASWLSVASYAVWFSCTAYMHAKDMLVPVAASATLGELWQGIPAVAFVFCTWWTVPLYASLKGTVQPVIPKPRRSQSFKLLSALSVAVAVAVTLPLAFFPASSSPSQTPTTGMKTTVTIFGAASLFLSVPSILLTTPALPIPIPIRRVTNFPLSKVCIYVITIGLSVLPTSITRIGSDVILILAFISTYVVPALLHITIHNFRRPLSIVIPPATPNASAPRLEPSDSRHDELLQRKEHTLQRRRLGRRLIWDIGVWVLLIPVGGGGVGWAVGHMVGKWRASKIGMDCEGPVVACDDVCWQRHTMDEPDSVELFDLDDDYPPLLGRQA